MPQALFADVVEGSGDRRRLKYDGPRRLALGVLGDNLGTLVPQRIGLFLHGALRTGHAQRRSPTRKEYTTRDGEVLLFTVPVSPILQKRGYSVQSAGCAMTAVQRNRSHAGLI